MLAAVGTNWRGTTLLGLLRSADHYNHAVPTDIELTQGLGRLIASGFVAQHKARFAVTSAGRALWKRSGGDVYDRVETLFHALKENPVEEMNLYIDAGDLGRAHERCSRYGR